MKYYSYSIKTRELCGDGEAQESPLEPGVFLLPAFATFTKPPKVKKGYALVYDDEQEKWHSVVDHRGKKYWLADNVPRRMSELGPLPKGASLEPTVKYLVEDANHTRKLHYMRDVDPLVMEAGIKRAMGLEDEANELMQKAIDMRKKIQAQFSKPKPDTLDK